MFGPVDARRRWFGAFFLIVAGGMVIWGETAFKSRLAGAVFLVYWLVCFLFVLLAMLTALLDIRAMRRRTRGEQRDLFQENLDEIKSDKQDKRQ